MYLLALLGSETPSEHEEDVFGGQSKCREFLSQQNLEDLASNQAHKTSSVLAVALQV